jgi:F420H(2)-dependent quinone reductase
MLTRICTHPQYLPRIRCVYQEGADRDGQRCRLQRQDHRGVPGDRRPFTAVAQELAGTARAELWQRLVDRYPTIRAHQAKTDRQFPALVLTRNGRPGQ